MRVRTGYDRDFACLFKCITERCLRMKYEWRILGIPLKLTHEAIKVLTGRFLSRRYAVPQNRCAQLLTAIASGDL
jgi:hypothetical protein